MLRALRDVHPTDRDTTSLLGANQAKHVEGVRLPDGGWRIRTLSPRDDGPTP